MSLPNLQPIYHKFIQLQHKLHNLANKLSGADARHFRMYILGAHRHKPLVQKFHFTLAGGHVGFVPISGRFDCLIYATISHNMVRTEPRFGQ